MKHQLPDSCDYKERKCAVYIFLTLVVVLATFIALKPERSRMDNRNASRPKTVETSGIRLPKPINDGLDTDETNYNGVAK